MARTIAIDPTVQAAQLALSTTGTSTQSNGVATALASLFTSTSPADWVNGASVQNLYASTATAVGQDLATARNQASSAQNALTAADVARKQVSGVSLNNEAVAIVALQRYFEASAKLISVLDTLTTTEINLIK